MESTLSPNKTASAIWGRVVKPDRGTLTPEVARPSSSSTRSRRPRAHQSAFRQGPGAPSQPRSGPSSRSMSGSTEPIVLQSKARLSLKWAKLP